MGYDTIKLEKDMYKSGNLSDVLERLDPSVAYQGTMLQDLDAFSRQLKRYDIKVNGSNGDTVEKFFANSNTVVLFPEYVRRCVQMGIDENDKVQDIISNIIETDGMDYRSVYAKPKNKTCNSVVVDEVYSALGISTHDTLVNVHNHGKLLHTSYESLRFQRISTLTTLLKQIGCHIARCQYHDAVEALSDKYFVVHKKVKNIIDDLALWLDDTDGYKLTAVLCSSSGFDILRKLLNDLIVFREDNYYCGETKIITSPAEPSNKIIGIDARYALEMIKCDSIKLDYRKLIDKQFESVEICSCAGFSVVCPDAIKSLDC